jgi:hypothetical protein
MSVTGCGQPHVLRFCDERGVRDEASVVAFLKSTTMVPLLVNRLCLRVTPIQVGLLPVPHPILVRKYHSNSNTQVRCVCSPRRHLPTPSLRCATLPPGLAHHLHLGHHIPA